MANDEQLKILFEQGAEEWNEWRIKHPTTPVDLSDSNLREQNFSTANLSDAKLSGAYLYKANLYAASLWGADLRHAMFRDADLRNVYLIKADLSDANLWSADLGNADLGNASLHRADLRFANLRRANLAGADLSQAYLNAADLREANLTGANLRQTFLGNVDLWNTVLADVDLSTAEGLDFCFHHGPSTLDHRTLAKSGDLPVTFLRGCGLDERMVASFRAQSGGPTSYSSAFISYNKAEEAFARKLHDTLQDRGVRCWFDKHAVKPGERILDVIGRAIGSHDKLLLCCSKAALNSWYVQDEIRKAQDRERKEGRSIIIPLDLDGYLRDWNDGLASDITSRNALDFTGWNEDAGTFEDRFEKLLTALRAEGRT